VNVTGEYRATGGLGGGTGGGSAVGGPGTVYIHKLPSNEMLLDGTRDDAVISHDSNVTHELTNRTLFVDNRDRATDNLSVTDAYGNLSRAGGIAWLIPGDLPEFVPSALGAQPSDIVIDYLQLYGRVEFAFLSRNCLKCSVTIRVANIEGNAYIISFTVYLFANLSCN